MQKRFGMIAGCIVLSVVAASCARKDTDDKEDSGKAAAAAPADRTADAAAIIRADSAWFRHVMAKNVDSLMMGYTPDAVSYSAEAAPAIGSDQVRAAYTEFVKSAVSEPAMNSQGVKFSDDGTMAYDYGTYALTATTAGGKPARQNGGFLNVWRKVDGQWKLVAEMSTPVPPPKS